MVYENAFLISKDTIDNGFNQIKGLRLIGLFRDNDLYNVDIIKNAEVINYSRDDNQELIGINQSKSRKINLKIEEDYKIITLIDQVDGDIWPESKLPQNARKLRGFDWREEERPKSVEDLFKDDPPLVLPIIKGLEDYVPQEDFFDAALMKRVEDATPKDAKKDEEQKASRTIPKTTLKKADSSKVNTLQKPTKKNN